ncbi:hypothetical protein AOB58_731 [Staphylococcus sp. AntiMn-1]|nr:hypothetical protein AOB58_731 [Staphylococcus sp. AntiMn-1]
MQAKACDLNWHLTNKESLVLLMQAKACDLNWHLTNKESLVLLIYLRVK